MITREVPEDSFLDWPGPIPYAHRGGDEVAPENTMGAFEAATREGFTYLETDVHMTAGGELIAWHDEHLEDGTPVADLSVADRKAVDLDGHEIPLMGDVLSTFPEARLSIDAKAEAAVEPLTDLLRDQEASGRVCVASFSVNSIAKLRGALPRGTASALAMDETLPMGLELFAGNTPNINFGVDTSTLVASLPRNATEIGDEGVAQIIRDLRGEDYLDEELVGQIQDLGLQVHVWTVNEADDMKELLGRGVDGIYTDKPSVLKSVMQEEGVWFE